MNKELRKFMLLSKDQFVERMRNVTKKDWELLDEALDLGWLRTDLAIWSMQVIAGSIEKEENLVDTACSFYYALFLGDDIRIISGKIISGLRKIMSNQEYKYARFRASRIIFFFGMDKEYSKSVKREDLDKAISVIQEFSQDEDVREIALSDLAQIV